MSTEKMTIHRALAELKLIDSRIDKQTREIEAVSVNKKEGLIQGYATEDSFSKEAQSKYDSVISLISRKTAIKSAIVRANIVNKVIIGEKTMTVADAITEKGNVALKTALANRLKQNHNAAVGVLNKNNEIVQSNVEVLLQNAMGADRSKADSKDIEAIQKPYVDMNQFHLVDPLKVIEKIEAIEKEVEQFEAEVDAVLSEANAINFIEI